MTIDTKHLRDLMAKATPGPWHCADHVGDGTTVATIGNTFIVGQPCNAVIDEEPDCALIVAAVNALPHLIDRMEKLEAVAKAAGRVQFAFGSKEIHAIEDAIINLEKP